MKTRKWVIIYLVSLALAGCGGVSDFDDDDACKNAGYAIASRTLDCTSNPTLANERYLSMRRSTRCTAKSIGETEFKCGNDPKCGLTQFTCAVMLNKTTCAEVASYGDDIDRWLAHSGYCANIMTHADGTALARPLASDNIQDNMVCAHAAEAMFSLRVDVCHEEDVSTNPAEQLNATYRCTAQWPDGTSPPEALGRGCPAGDLTCADVVGKTYAEIAAASPGCAQIMVLR